MENYFQDIIHQQQKTMIDIRREMYRILHPHETPAVIVEPAYQHLNFDYNLVIGAENCVVPTHLVEAEVMQTGEDFSNGTTGEEDVDTEEAQVTAGNGELNCGQACADMMIPGGDTIVIDDNETTDIHDDETIEIPDDESVEFHDEETVIIQNDDDSQSNEVSDNSNMANYANARENYFSGFFNSNEANSDHNCYGELNGSPEFIDYGDNIEDTQTEDYWDNNQEPNYSPTRVEPEQIFNEDSQSDNEMQTNDEPNHTEGDQESDYIDVESVDNEPNSITNVTIVEVRHIDPLPNEASDDDLEGDYERNYARRRRYRRSYNEDTQSDDDESDAHEHRNREIFCRYERSNRDQSEFPGIYGHINCHCKRCVRCGNPIIRFQSDLIRTTRRLNEKMEEIKKYEHFANILQRALDLPYDANRDMLVMKILKILKGKLRSMETARAYGKRKARMQKYCTECELNHGDYYYRRSRYRN